MRVYSLTPMIPALLMSTSIFLTEFVIASAALLIEANRVRSSWTNFTYVVGLIDLSSLMTEEALDSVRPRSRSSAGFPWARKIAV